MSNYKMVCIDNIDNTGLYTTGKVYEVKDGVFEADNGEEIIAGSFDEWEKESTAKWSLVDFDIKEQVIHLFRLCMQAKEKGHHCFFNYYPHVNSNEVEISIYKDGWSEEKSHVKYVISTGHETPELFEVETRLKELISDVHT